MAEDPSSLPCRELSVSGTAGSASASGAESSMFVTSRNRQHCSGYAMQDPEMSRQAADLAGSGGECQEDKVSSLAPCGSNRHRHYCIRGLRTPSAHSNEPRIQQSPQVISTQHLNEPCHHIRLAAQCHRRHEEYGRHRSYSAMSCGVDSGTRTSCGQDTRRRGCVCGPDCMFGTVTAAAHGEVQAYEWGRTQYYGCTSSYR